MKQAFLAAALAVGIATPVAAQDQQCGPAEALHANLATRYDETPRAQGLSHTGQEIIVIYGSEASGSWSLVVVRPDGTACLLAAGQMFRALEAVATGEPT